MSRATLILDSEAKRRTAADWAARLPKGTRVEFKAPRRSGQANDLMWARLTEISRQVEWYGQHLSAEDWKDVLTASLRKARVVPGLEAGSFVPLGMRTSDMSKAEMSDLLELVAAFAAEQGVVFHESEEAA